MYADPFHPSSFFFCLKFLGLSTLSVSFVSIERTQLVFFAVISINFDLVRLVQRKDFDDSFVFTERYI